MNNTNYNVIDKLNLSTCHEFLARFNNCKNKEERIMVYMQIYSFVMDNMDWFTKHQKIKNTIYKNILRHKDMLPDFDNLFREFQIKGNMHHRL